MPRFHKHWSEDHPRYGAAPVCRFKTKKACDRNWTEFQHGHVGRRCVKAVQPSKTRAGEPNKIETCTISVPPDTSISFTEQLRAAGAASLAAWDDEGLPRDEAE